MEDCTARRVPKFARSLLVVLMAALVVPAASTFAQEAVALVPYTSESYGFSSVAPEAWGEVADGVVARQASGTDSALLVQQSVPIPPQAALDALLPQLGLSEAPPSAGTHQGETLRWMLYEVETLGVAVDLALSEAADATYIVIMQSPPAEHDALHDAVFLPALDAFAPLAPDEEPVPYDVEEVTFASGEITLAGTLTLPPTAGPHPAIVLVSGSGPQNRDESLGGGIAIRPFRLLADALTRAGVAVLRYDERGVGGSSGTYSTATLTDFAADAEAALAYLLSRDDVDPDRLGLLGHSEGGLISAMLGARNDNVDFIISLAGPAVNGRDVLRLQIERVAAAEGASPEDVAAQSAFADDLLANLDDPGVVETLVYERTLAEVEALPEEQRAALGDLEEHARRVAKQTAEELSRPWFRSFLDYDPGDDWARTAAPVLAIFGGKDVQVGADQNEPVLAGTLQRGGNDRSRTVVLPDANHLFQAAETGAPSEYATLPAEFTASLIPTIIGWLQDQGIIAPSDATPPAP